MQSYQFNMESIFWFSNMNISLPNGFANAVHYFSAKPKQTVVITAW